MDDTDKNCLSYWFPILETSGVPVPRTVIYRSDPSELYQIFDGKTNEGIARLVAQIRRSMIDLGGPPVFLRTGHGSHKHRWDRTCNLRDTRKILDHIAELVEWSCSVDMLGLPLDVWVVREMLPVRPLFHAFLGMPIVEEWRYFVRGGNIQCCHPYWPPESILNPTVDDWRERLEGLEASTEADRLAEQVAHAIDQHDGGYWSVDVLLSARGCFVTDMALGERSWHWPNCGDELARVD